MDRRNKPRKRLIVAVIAGVALAAVAAGAVMAGSGDDKPLEGTTYERATEAALEEVGGGDVIETEVGDDGAAYGVEVRKGDGSVVEVNLDAEFNVVGSEPDDDGADDEEDGPNDD